MCLEKDNIFVKKDKYTAFRKKTYIPVITPGALVSCN
jgi:hypothetical protein